MHGLWWIWFGAVLVLAVLWGALTIFSPKARLQRRRRKSHSRVIAKGNRPMVRFSVRPPKE
jgi:hypothetical protein